VYGGAAPSADRALIRAHVVAAVLDLDDRRAVAEDVELVDQLGAARALGARLWGDLLDLPLLREFPVDVEE
jgi:hypothetical protein